MLRHLFFAFCALSVWAAALQAHATLPAFLQDDGVVACPVTDSDKGGNAQLLPSFDGPDCQTIGSQQIDPQNEFIWVKGQITLDKTTGPDGEPLALFVLGKMSSAFYINGTYIGSNGTPGPDAITEIPGHMDTVFYLPPSLLRIGPNEIAFKASAHRGLFHLQRPLHMIMIDKAENITDKILRRYWPSLLTLGTFLAGAIYFAVTGFNSVGRQRALTFSLICAFAAAQLSAEVYRGLVAYAYPVHDTRLLLITAFSAGFGLSVAFHVFSTFHFKRLWPIMAATAAATSIAILIAPGFDNKAAAAMMTPLIACLVATGVLSFQRQPRAFSYFLSLAAFLAAIFAFPHLFLDVVFFYFVAAFIIFLFIEQGFALVHEAKRRRHEQARADRLELALEQAKEREEASIISIKSAGKVERISTDQITHFRGASGYSEIILDGGREILHTATLTDMEESLPATFLRVHRSHLVNTAFIKSLKRDPAGTGTLILSDGSVVPVSRRIMPKVREALS